MKVSELSGARLDYWVARVGGNRVCMITAGVTFQPSNNWAQGGPIIDEASIYFEPSNFERDGKVFAYVEGGRDIQGGEYGETRLIAAMRAYVASKFGDEVADEEAA